jgi:hypothetical protein
VERAAHWIDSRVDDYRGSAQRIGKSERVADVVEREPAAPVTIGRGVCIDMNDRLPTALGRWAQADPERVAAATSAATATPTLRSIFMFDLPCAPVRTQNGQLPGAGLTSCRRIAPAGMSWTAIVFATAPLSSRMMCTAPPPMSTNEFVPVAEYTCGVQVGSSPSYSVTVTRSAA